MEHRGGCDKGMDSKDEVAREWEWLNEAINRVARARAEDETDNAFRLLQQQAMAVGQRRVELRLRLAKLESNFALARHHGRPSSDQVSANYDSQRQQGDHSKVERGRP